MTTPGGPSLQELLNADLESDGLSEGSGMFGGKVGKYVGVPDDYRTIRNPGPISADQVERNPDVGFRTPSFDEAYYNTRVAALADSPEAVFAMQRELVKAGLIGPKTKFRVGALDNPTLGAYRKLLTYANLKGISDERQAFVELLNTPLASASELAGLDVDGDGKPDIESGGGEQAFSGKKKTQAKDVNHTDPFQARRLMRSTLRETLGRAPTDAEYKAFMSALYSTEDAMPVVTDTTTTFENGEAVGSTQFRNGGVDAAGFAEEYAQQGDLGKEANTFRVATDYYSAALSVLGEGGA